MSDAPSKSLDPTESVRTLTSKAFRETYMSLREHQDTDKHYIGDALPVPSSSMVQAIGASSSAGVQPFPARADHSHDAQLAWGFFSSGYQTVPPGSVFINNLTHTGWGKQMLASGQVLAFPYRGTYLIQIGMTISRDSGGIFQNEMNVLLYYANGSSSKTILRQSNFDLPGNMYLNLTDIAIANTAPSTNDNVQICVQHNDSSNWSVAIHQLFVFRVSSVFSS